MTTEFALEQLERKSLTFAHTKSVLAFVKQVMAQFMPVQALWGLEIYACQIL